MQGWCRGLGFRVLGIHLFGELKARSFDGDATATKQYYDPVLVPLLKGLRGVGKFWVYGLPHCFGMTFLLRCWCLHLRGKYLNLQNRPSVPLRRTCARAVGGTA